MIDAVGMEAHGTSAPTSTSRRKPPGGEAIAASLHERSSPATQERYAVDHGCLYGVVPVGILMNKGMTGPDCLTFQTVIRPRLLEHAAGELDPSISAAHKLSLEEAPRLRDVQAARRQVHPRRLRS